MFKLLTECNLLQEFVLYENSYWPLSPAYPTNMYVVI